MGGGYDMVGTVIGQWLEALFQPQLRSRDGAPYLCSGHQICCPTSTGFHMTE